MSAPRDQHFLVDKRAIERIVGAIDVAGRRILEIGPGTGNLTRALLDHGAVVIAVEIDPLLFEDLGRAFAPEIRAGQLELLLGDASRCDLPFFESVISNLPYSLSSKLTFRLLAIGFDEAVLMYQSEFAQRMLAQPGSRDYGRLSVMVQTYAHVTRLFDLSPSCFTPKPQVRSTVVKLRPREPPYPLRDRKLYAEMVRVLFSHRRKTVRNGLRSARGLLDEETIERMQRDLPDGILHARPEDLNLEEFARIANAA
ncbi:MAG: 16S rRNA (adenine(1518)-N(6)/adenine(1519)-N(6))-dimethyltransferase RsmA [Methanomicrobiales archaeon]|nr:16S rRNA (adenine(1518)-N(6)/adenine(1519)-N(6))-dimethyltransferase RsmA [Methanomicrobiales archaeon]MDI6875312.1 16S rRNA (adenine(1518)-N(6)/adenine(1519)-N(6))-dimethyltransferase RsmA [Methanomicrobiales archaeon]